MKGVYLFLAEGFEETEALTTVDMLRRGGAGVIIVSITENPAVTSSHGITVMADKVFSEFKAEAVIGGTEKDDVMIFPGGMPGSTNLAGCGELMELLLLHYGEGGTVAAICAAPSVVLSRLPGLEGRTMTCYDGFEEPLKAKGAIYTKDGVVTDGNIITGRGAGHTVAFGLAVLTAIKGAEAAERVAKSIML